MARGVRSALAADVAVATTGVAGPDAAEGHRPGTVCIGISLPEGDHAITAHLPGRRQQVREFATITALDALRRLLATGD
jgi:nicotinamide mononucleotide (NMN) deamidase PncC